MRYIHTKQPDKDAATHLANSIQTHLANGERVLWFVSGGSGIGVSVAAADLLQGKDLKNLVVTLSDERYGKVGHADENWKQLLEAGFVLTGAKLYRPLRTTDKLTTIASFESWVKAQMKEADFTIGLFGIGTDGHTAGIKPLSLATSAAGYTTFFVGDDYERLTITYQTIHKLDEAVIQAAGTTKAEVIKKLMLERILLNEMPASMLHKVPVATLYTDQSTTK